MRNGRSFDAINDVVPVNHPVRLIPFQYSPKILRKILKSGSYYIPDNSYEKIFSNQEMYESGF